MSIPWFSDEWARVCGEAIHTSEAYRAAAATWEWSLVLVLCADPLAGVEDDQPVYLDLYHGDCRIARAATPADIETADYLISGNPVIWKRILSSQLDPIMAVMTGKLKLEKGNMATLALYVKAAKEMVVAVRQVKTSFPPGLE